MITNQNYHKRTNSDSHDTVLRFFNQVAHNESESVFGHGALVFDDYNYGNINKELFALEKESVASEEQNNSVESDGANKNGVAPIPSDLTNHNKKLVFSPS